MSLFFIYTHFEHVEYINFQFKATSLLADMRVNTHTVCVCLCAIGRITQPQARFAWHYCV